MDLIIKTKIKQELKKLNILYSDIELIQNKDGVIVARVQSEAKSFIIKSNLSIILPPIFYPDYLPTLVFHLLT